MLIFYPGQKKQVLLSVRERLVRYHDGPGIPVADREAVICAEYSPTESSPGLGVSIAEQIVEADGWGMHITKSDGGGARYKIMGVEFVTG